jgi:hypothetical protein
LRSNKVEGWFIYRDGAKIAKSPKELLYFSLRLRILAVRVFMARSAQLPPKVRASRRAA